MTQPVAWACAYAGDTDVYWDPRLAEFVYVPKAPEKASVDAPVPVDYGPVILVERLELTEEARRALAVKYAETMRVSEEMDGRRRVTREMLQREVTI